VIENAYHDSARTGSRPPVTRRERVEHVQTARRTSYISTQNKKSPVNANGNAQQRCIFESPVKHNLSSSNLATIGLFLLQWSESARRPAANCLRRVENGFWRVGTALPPNFV